MDVPYTTYIFTSTTSARFTKLIILKGFLQTYNKETISLNKEILCLFGVLIFVLKPFFLWPDKTGSWTFLKQTGTCFERLGVRFDKCKTESKWNFAILKSFIIDRPLFQIFRHFFLKKVWLLNIVPYVSESRKLPVPGRTFGLGACDIIMTWSETQKLVLMPWTQSKVIKTLVIDVFSWDSSKTIFSIKTDNILTPHNSKWGVVTSSDLENTFLQFKAKPRIWKRIKIIVFHEKLQKQLFW